MTRITDQLLNAVWTDQVNLLDTEDSSELRSILDDLLPFQKILLIVPDGPLCNRVFAEETELLPALPFGDVLAEELSINVPSGAIIVCLSKRLVASGFEDAELSMCLGRICGEVIADAVHLGNYRIDREHEAGALLSEIIRSNARRTAMRQRQISIEQFQRALVKRVRDIIGVPAAESVHEGLQAKASQQLAYELPETLALSLRGASSEDRCFDTWRQKLEEAVLIAKPDLSPSFQSTKQKSTQVRF